MTYAIRYTSMGGGLLKLLGLGPRFSSIHLDDDTFRVQMGWGFRATVPRSSITAAAPSTRRPLSRGMHGWGGRWLVNGSGKGLVTLTIDPPASARVTGIPVRLRELTVSADAPTELIEALAVG